MTEKELLDIIKAWENIEIVCTEVSTNPVLLELLISIALNNPQKHSWRAAYLVDKIHDSKPLLIKPYIGAITEKLKTEKNNSKRRHWLKLISMNDINEDYLSFLFDYCFEAFTSGNEAVAIRVHAMQILYNISNIETDLKPEVYQVIEQELEFHPTAGIRSRGKKLVKKLWKEIQKQNK